MPASSSCSPSSHSSSSAWSSPACPASRRAVVPGRAGRAAQRPRRRPRRRRPQRPVPLLLQLGRPLRLPLDVRPDAPGRDEPRGRHGAVPGPGLGGASPPAVLPGPPPAGLAAADLHGRRHAVERQGAGLRLPARSATTRAPRAPTRSSSACTASRAGPSGFLGLDFLSSVDALTVEHRLAPSIVVVPRIDTPASLDTECVNGGAGQPQTDTWLAHDIPAWTGHHFRVERKRGRRGPRSATPTAPGARRRCRCATPTSSAPRSCSSATSARTSARPTTP